MDPLGFAADGPISPAASQIAQLQKAFARTGVPINRTTLGDLFHAASRATEPLYKRLLELIRTEEYVRADSRPPLLQALSVLISSWRPRELKRKAT